MAFQDTRLDPKHAADMGLSEVRAEGDVRRLLGFHLELLDVEPRRLEPARLRNTSPADGKRSKTTKPASLTTKAAASELCSLLYRNRTGPYAVSSAVLG